jgi:hypothetical protein
MYKDLNSIRVDILKLLPEALMLRLSRLGRAWSAWSACPTATTDSNKSCSNCCLQSHQPLACQATRNLKNRLTPRFRASARGKSIVHNENILAATTTTEGVSETMDFLTEQASPCVGALGLHGAPQSAQVEEG